MHAFWPDWVNRLRYKYHPKLSVCLHWARWLWFWCLDECTAQMLCSIKGLLEGMTWMWMLTETLQRCRFFLILPNLQTTRCILKSFKINSHQQESATGIVGWATSMIGKYLPRQHSNTCCLKGNHGQLLSSSKFWNHAGKEEPSVDCQQFEEFLNLLLGP